MWLNRKEIPLPNKECKILFKHKDGINGIFEGIWYPYNPNNYYPDTMPAEGYLGTVRVVVDDPILKKYWRSNEPMLIGYHVWKQNDSEFLEYQLIEQP